MKKEISSRESTVKKAGSKMTVEMRITNLARSPRQRQNLLLLLHEVVDEAEALVPLAEVEVQREDVVNECGLQVLQTGFINVFRFTM
ncbi:hypothetical protein GCK32_022431 [Trichostrongylus colubriformis]|uniref:Uncharacterized protein n=1 Tax=Trichostrongylus colubriformis TaxID=6319 RepID=A0AAN8FM76_TRICO